MVQGRVSGTGAGTQTQAKACVPSGRGGWPSPIPLGSLAPPIPDATLYLFFGGRVAMVNTWQGREREE